MARAGLGPAWTCLFANDFDAKKGVAYEANWGRGGELRVARTSTTSPHADLAYPAAPSLAWASFPCQDLSLAGDRAGLKGRRSGTFFPFWDLMLAPGRAGAGANDHRAGERLRRAHLARRG